MINVEKLYYLESVAARAGDARRIRSERHREYAMSAKTLRTAATVDAHPDMQTMSLAALLALPEVQLADAGVDVRTLKRAALENRRAQDEVRTTVQEDAEHHAILTLAQACRHYAGADV